MTNEEPAITAHVIIEDERYPLLCINGKFTYGVFINPQTGEIDKKRVCICGGRGDECFCDL